MSTYLLKRVLLIVPTLFGIMLISFAIVQFAPGGPVERVIAQISGTDVAATARISGSQGDGLSSSTPSQTGGQGGSEVTSKYRGAQGLDPAFIELLFKLFDERRIESLGTAILGGHLATIPDGRPGW